MDPASAQRSYCHAGGQTPLLGCTVDALFREVASRHRDREAIVSVAQGRRLTYGALDAEVERAARALLALGVARGDRVGIWSTDNAEWVVLQLATARAGAVLVNINPANRVPELRHALGLARVQDVFFIPSFRTSRYAAMLAELCPDVSRLDADAFAASPKPGLPDLRRLVVFDPDDPQSRDRLQPGMLTWREFLDRGRDVPAAQVVQRQESLDPDDPVNIQFTSGTTGFPKAVVLTHHNILNNGWFIGEAMGFTERDRLCVPVPFYHCFGMVVSTLACLTHGSALVIPAPHFEAGATLAAIESERCTAIHGVPTMFIAELERPDFARYDLSSLRTGIMAGAPCPPDLMRRVIERMGCREILIGYGQTESSPVTHLTRPHDSFEKRTGTVGTNLPHQEVKVVDPSTGAVQPVGTAGEVCFRGYHVMRGYLGQPEATRRAIDEAGWLHSGDIGVMDGEGYLRITGRIKDMIIRGGEKIYPAEIEAFYFEHPAVAEIAVFGVPDPRFGEEVGAWVRLREGARADPEALREWARGRIAHYKVPRYVWLVEEFPTTVTGKVQKYRIREMVAEWMARAEASQGRLPPQPGLLKHSPAEGR
jgi:fatty-acyl-CoA synthase